MSKFVNSIVVAAIISVASSEPAFAYIDPGTGSMILQGIIGGVAGGLFIMRTYWARVVSFFSGGRKGAPAEVAGEASQTGRDA